MSIFNQLFNIGVLRTASNREQKRVKILNLIIYISLVHSSFFLCFASIRDSLNWQKTTTLSLELFFFSTLLLLQYKRLFKSARLFFTFTVFTNLFYHCNYAFKGEYGEYQYIVIPLFALFFFEKKYIHYGLLVLSIIAFYVPNIYYKIYPDEYYGYFNVLLFFLGVFLIVNFFKTLNKTNEELLEIEKKNTQEDKVILENQQIELENLNEFKSHFFVNISHEIKTPITLIKGYASKIYLDEESTSNLKYLDILKSQTQYIQDLVDSILDLSKLEANKLEIQREDVNVIHFIKKIYTDFNEVYKGKKIEFILDATIPEMLINIDVSFFRKAINNLLNNALKFTAKEGKVVLKAEYYNAELQISVIDNGIGIPQKDINNVFNRFYQSKNDITKSQGSGIGLAFTKSIVDAHEFELSLESKPNKETKFTILIPSNFLAIMVDDVILKEEYFFNIKEGNNNSEIISKKILIIDDHQEMRNYLKLILKDYQIIEASNGKEGLKELHKHKFDTIITDYMIPVMDDFNFVNEIKKRSLKTPIIIITARSDDKGKLDILRLGIDAYITKPFLEEELLLHVKKSINYYENIKKFKHELPDNRQNLLADKEQSFYHQLKLVIENNYQDTNFGVEDLAGFLNLSRSSLFRKTKLLLEQTPNDIINEIRFEKAIAILEKQPEIKKKDLAEAVGIYNVSYFLKKLKEHYGTF